MGIATVFSFSSRLMISRRAFSMASAFPMISSLLVWLAIFWSSSAEWKGLVIISFIPASLMRSPLPSSFSTLSC